MEHTPGPWKVECGAHEDDFIVTEPTGLTICEPNAPLFADRESFEQVFRVITLKEAKANARLIAAAPELLEALRKADDIAETLDCMDGLTAEGRKAQRLGNKLHELVTKAIAKAEEKQ